MARIYVKPQVRSSRPPRPRTLDYSVIEQIANGIEKMVVSWNNAKVSRIRPYDRSSAPPIHFSTKTTRISSAPPKQSDETVQAGSSQFGEPTKAGTSGATVGGATEMSIFLRSPGPLDEMIASIPNLSGIVGAEMVKQCQEQIVSNNNGDHQVINSSSANYWYLKTSSSSSNNNHNCNELYGLDNPPNSSRAEDSIPTSSTSVSTAAEDGSIGMITPRLKSAVERIEGNFNLNSSQERARQQEVVASSPGANEGVDSVRVPKTSSSQDAAVTDNHGYGSNERSDDVTERSGSDQTDSGFKESYSDGTPYDSIPHQVSTNQVDDWTETSEIVGDENVRDLIAFSKKKEAVQETEELLDDYKVKVEELQIALLECSTEYEVKIVEMKMMMLNLKSKYRQQMSSGNGKVFETALGMQTKDFALVTSSQEKQRVEFLKKQMQKLKHDKENLSRELFTLKKKQRQSEKQKKSLDDALNKVSSLKRELAKRDEEILDSHLREKEAKAQLNELHLALQSARAAQAEPGKLLALLPVLRNWLKTVKKGQYYHEPSFGNNVENYPPYAQGITRKPSLKENRQNPRVDRIVGSVTKEIQALQKALEKLAYGRYL